MATIRRIRVGAAIVAAVAAWLALGVASAEA